MIPNFQYSPDPAINPNINPFVSMPPGMYQAGVYTVQPAYSGAAPLVSPLRPGDNEMGFLGSQGPTFTAVGFMAGGGPSMSLSFSNVGSGVAGGLNYAIEQPVPPVYGPGGMSLGLPMAVNAPKVYNLSGINVERPWIWTALGAAALTLGWVKRKKIKRAFRRLTK